MLLEIALLVIFTIGFIAGAVVLAVVLPFPSPQEQEEMGIHLHGQGR